MFIIELPYYHAMALGAGDDEATGKLDESSDVQLAGAGNALLLLATRGSAMQLDRDGERQLVQGSVIEQLKQRHVPWLHVGLLSDTLHC